MVPKSPTAGVLSQSSAKELAVFPDRGCFHYAYCFVGVVEIYYLWYNTSLCFVQIRLHSCIVLCMLVK